MLPRPKTKAKRKASKADEKTTTSLIDAMKGYALDFALAWVANIQAEMRPISWQRGHFRGFRACADRRDGQSRPPSKGSPVAESDLYIRISGVGALCFRRRDR